MMCRSCHHDDAWHVNTIYDKEFDVYVDQCNFCGLDGAGSWTPDVYLAHSGQKFQNLCDKMGNPIEIRSKRHKAEVMRQMGVSEAGDRVNGAPIQPRSWAEGTREYRRKNFEKDRPMIRELYGRYLANARKK